MSSSPNPSSSNPSSSNPDASNSGKETSSLMEPIFSFLLCRTPKEWLELAQENEAVLMIDHAHCEKKAASTALSLIYRYADKPELLKGLSQLAREELLHFEQVLELIEKRGHQYAHLQASNYASGLHAFAAKSEPDRLTDALIIGAIIEARSCERFYSLIDYVDDELSSYYRYLLKSESRHFQDYLDLARLYAEDDIGERITFFLAEEEKLIEGVDELYRFHSGAPLKN